MPVDFTPALERLDLMVGGFVRNTPNILLGVFAFILLLLLAKGIRWIVTLVASRANFRHGVAVLLGRLVQGVSIFIALLVALSVMIPTFRAGDIVEFLGIGSVAIGFAFRDVLQNYLAGILILITEPFHIGDQIITNQYEGTVEDIQSRATYLRTYDGRRVVIPNTRLFTEPVTVNTAFDHRRMEYDVGIGVSDDIAAAKRLMMDAMRATEGVLEDPSPDVLVVDLGDFAIKLRARYWVVPPRRRDVLYVQDEVLTRIKESLVAHGIDLPYPTQQVLFHDQTEATDGDRAAQREGWPARPSGDNPRPNRIADALRMLRSRGGRNGAPQDDPRDQDRRDSDTRPRDP